MIDSLRELYRSSPRHTGAREDSSARAPSGEHTHTHTPNTMLKPFLVPRHAEEKITKTLNNGYLGSRNDEERSEMRYVVRIAGCKRVIESLNAYCARGSGRGHVCLSVSRYPQLRLLGATLDLAVPDVSSGSAEAQWRASPPQVFGVRTIRRGKWDASRTLSTGASGKRGAWRQPAGALFSFAPAKLFFTF